jgi:hypothetical protein
MAAKASQIRPYEWREERRPKFIQPTYLAMHRGKDVSTRVALVDPAEDDDKENDLGGEHRRIVREPPRYFCDDTGADLPVPLRARLKGRVRTSLTVTRIYMARTLTVTEKNDVVVSK